MPDNRNPWKTLHVKEVYDNPWIRVDEHDVVNPSGKPGIYGKVHYKNVACGIIPLDENNDTWLIGQYRYTLDRYSWEIPMGGVPVDADPLAGAQRELKEETGLTADRWELILDADISNSITDETGVVYVAEGLTAGDPEFDETEKLEIRKLPFSEVVQMIHDGAITDVLSIAGILKLAAMARG